MLLGQNFLYEPIEINMKNNYKDFLKLKNKSIIIIGGTGLIGSDISLAFFHDSC